MKKRFIQALIAIILLFVGNITFIITRSTVMGSVFSGMAELQDERDDVFDALLGINELTSLGEHVHNWTDQQMEEYRSLRLRTDSALERLDGLCPHQTVDSMRDNLSRKEDLLQRIVEVTRMKSESEEHLTTDKEVTVNDRVTTIKHRTGNIFQKHKEEVTSTSKQRKIHVETVDEEAFEQMQSQRQSIKELTDSLAVVNHWLVHNSASLVKTNQGTLSTLMREKEDEGKTHRKPTAVDATTDYVAYLLATDFEELENNDNGSENGNDNGNNNGFVPEGMPTGSDYLIDSFIENDTKITLQEELEYTPEINDSEGEDDNSDEYLTETLAGIYIKQGRYQKALDIMEKVNSKSGTTGKYYEDQKRFLQLLIDNSKK